MTEFPGRTGIEDRLREVELEIAARRPEHQVSPTLDRIAMLVSLLGDPHRAFPVIHVTGTNGKTSMTRMIDTLLRLVPPADGFAVSAALAAEGVTVELDLAGTVDVEAERKRLEKDLAAARKEAQQMSGKLGNAAFTEKAPADVVEKTKQRLAAAEADIVRLQARLVSLA